jgi:hypothetical protein
MGVSLADLNPFKIITDTVGKVLDKTLTDKNARASAQEELDKLVLSGELAQMAAQTDINKIEAASPNLFVSGWRPATGWICNLGLLYEFVVRPLLTWASMIVGHPVIAPDLDMGTLVTLLLGLLGMGGLRSFDKQNGVASK